jgi:phosphoglycerate dehydrogenase-like enzyme
VQLRVAVAPLATAWLDDAVVAGGGVVVAVESAPEALIWTDPTKLTELREILDATPTITWVQLPLAGVEKFFASGVVDPQRTWTSAKGSYSEPVAEHALALALAGLRVLPERARARSWGREAGVSLFDQAVTIVGGGGITSSLLELLAPFRVRATVVRQRPEPMRGAARVVGTESLMSSLAEARVVFLALALTPSNRHMFASAQFGAMDSTAWLVNVARGGLVHTDDLVEALRKGVIGGAALDVTDPEPLPDGHPLWDLENCLITPHVADTDDMVRPLLSDRVTQNVRRRIAGQPLIGLMDIQLGY